MAGDVFISYSRRDQEFVLRLVGDLEDRQAFTWIDRGNIGGGQRWRDAIERGIRDCRVFILVVSPDSMGSSNVAQELEFAFSLNKPVLPLIYRNTRIPSALEDRLREYQYLQFDRGGYASNLLDLIDALAQQGVRLDVDRARLERRRDERLGAPVETEWGAVFSRVPGWALAWAIGWAIFWVVVPIVAIVVTRPDETSDWFVLPIGGFVGGLVGGVFAGFFTMVSLRHNASSIRWRHMSPAIWIWSLVGPIGVVAAFGIALASMSVPAATECTEFGQCIGQAIGSAIGAAIVAILAALLYTVIAVFVIGAVAGWLAVRAIRRLEPGIVGLQTAGVLISWGLGSIVAAIATLVAASVVGGSLS